MGKSNLTIDSTTLPEVDLDRFWADDAVAQRDPFGSDIPQPPMGLDGGYHYIFAELGLPEDLRRFEEDYEFARQCARRYNELSKRILGKARVDETAYDPSKRFPHVKDIGEIFGCQRIWQSNSWWLQEAAHTPEELEKLLDRVEKLDLREAMTPANWESECRRIYEQHGLRPLVGARPKHGRSLRGPVTLAMSIYGVENLIWLIVDQPKLAQRFRDVMLKVLLEYFTVCDELSHPSMVKPGFNFFDDSCAMLTPDMYAFFGQPILKALFAKYAPRPEDMRYQHSDSAMEHLLPLLAEAGLKCVNFGPTIRFSTIRKAMPKAAVEGTMAPYTLMRNEEEKIALEVRRDLDEARDTRGLIVTTAGSVNDGTLLRSIRLVMHLIQKYGRYQ